jgi:gliding motility-associated-like protein
MFPYTYEIVTGPQVFPPQASNVFSISQFGNYTARITDQCGYSNTLFFTVDSFSFKPVFKNGSSCNGGATTLSYPHSQYIHYKWVNPSGVAYTGDTLFINPTTAADVGLYHITQYVSINGCNDSFTTTYLLTQNSVHYYTDTICKGSSLQFGNHVYTETGIYTDTIAVSGCDSVIVLYLWAEYAHDTVVADLCPNTTFTYRNKTYTAGGIYADTITGTGCDTIVTIQIISHDYRRGTITQFICAGQQYAFAGQVYAQTGIYRDTIFSNSQCDSITTLYLGIADYLRKNITTTICAGHSYQVGNNYYNLTGMYVDTLITDEGCDSIVTLNLTVAPYPQDTINASICEGEQYKLGSKIYTVAGAYIDTFSVAGCDTIYYLQLTVFSLPEGDTALQTFEMEYADTLQLSACGIDSAYIWSTGACANCNTISVSPKVLNSYYQCTIINTYHCSVVCNYKVHVNGLYGDIFVPNVFTPNGDGNNDVFKIYGNHIRLVRLMVYNRWGEKVFEGSDIANVWDGTYKGEQAPQGVYVYVLKYFAGINTNADELKGSVTLLR